MSETHLPQTSGKNGEADPFGKNAAAALAYKKAERLVTATYLVTNHVPKSESLRSRVRDICSALLTDTIQLREGFASSGVDALAAIVAEVRLVLSFLDALFASGLISEMNLRILKEAYLDFVHSLEVMRDMGAAEGFELTSDYFGQTTSHKKLETPRLQTLTPPALPVKKQQKTATLSTQQPTADAIVVGAPQSPRTDTIIEFISKRGEATVPDIAQIIQGCSSKTLQRDLAALVQRGVLARFGNKRWTKYRLS